MQTNQTEPFDAPLIDTSNDVSVIKSPTSGCLIITDNHLSHYTEEQLKNLERLMALIAKEWS